MRKKYLSDFEILKRTFGVPPRLFVGCRRLVFLSKLLHTNQHHVIALDLASDCKQNRSWVRAALQDAILLGRLESFREFSGVDGFHSLFCRLAGLSVSSLKNRMKNFLLTKILSIRVFGVLQSVSSLLPH